MEKKVVLITGTNSGFGYLTARSCAEKGYTVYATIRDINGRNAEKAKELSAVENINNGIRRTAKARQTTSNWIKVKVILNKPT